MDFLFRWVVLTVITLVITIIMGLVLILAGTIIISYAYDIPYMYYLSELQWWKFLQVCFVGSVIVGIYKAIDDSQE